MSTTRPLPSHSAQVKETRRSLYNSESGVKKMAVRHHLSERSHTIEPQRKDFVNLGGRWVRVGLAPWWSGDLGVGLERGVGLGPVGVRWVFVSGD